jgi:hypothetical protein
LGAQELRPAGSPTRRSRPESNFFTPHRVALRHHHETRQVGEETITLPYEFVSLHVEPRDFLNGTPKNLYATTPPSP